MSKTLGNGIDPIEVIDEYGADALRFAVVSGTTMGNDIRYMPEKLEQASNFANKIWNAAKFIIMNMPSEEKVRTFSEKVFTKVSMNSMMRYNAKLLNIEDKWLLNKLDKLVADVTRNLENYDLGVALDKIYSFIWNEFCDWYIEMVKPRIYSDSEDEKIVVSTMLNYVFGTSLKLLHPFMPFVTTEIYSKLVNYGIEDLIIAEWPKGRDEFAFEKQEELIEKIKEIIVGIRNVRSTNNIHPSKKSELILITSEYKDELKEAEEILLKLGFAEKIIVFESNEEIDIIQRDELENAISVILSDIEVYIPLKGLIDIEEEKTRLRAEVAKLEGEVARGEKMLSNPGFINKAPEEKVNAEKEKLEKYREMLILARERLEKIEKSSN